MQRYVDTRDNVERGGEIDVARSLRRTSSETIACRRGAIGADSTIAADGVRFHAKQIRQGVRVLRGELAVSYAAVDFHRVVAVTGVDVVARAGIPVILQAEIHPH